MKKLLVVIFLLLPAAWLNAQEFVPNYDESKVPAYKLPDPLVFENGFPVRGKRDWEKRRQELYNIFEKQMYGRVPAGKISWSARLLSTDSTACSGQAIRTETRLVLQSGDRELPLNILLVLPKTKHRVPVFLGYNFGGNHTVSADPGIRVPSSWVRNNAAKGITDNHAREADRGSDAAGWPLAEIIRRGYGIATLYYGDVDPDFHDGFKNGAHALFNAPRDSSSWGSIAAWAWGLSRVMDWLSGLKTVDSKRVVVWGHSRLGKTALWAGASDKRFAIVISNESGSGGAALSLRKYGETVTRTNTAFPHWFCDNFKKYNRREESLPFDQHEVLALVAPRPVYVAVAEDDKWGDPRGSFLACVAASPVYRLLGCEGFPATSMPGPEHPVSGTIGFHLRQGVHDVKPYDWSCYLNFADKFFKKR